MSSATGPRRRRRTTWSAVLVAAAAVVAVVGGALISNRTPARHPGALSSQVTNTPTPAGGGAQASCVGPFLRADPLRSPPDPFHPSTFGSVRPGRTVIVYGWCYYRPPCNDTPGDGEPVHPVEPIGSVRLVLVTADGRVTALGAAHPRGGDASFAAAVTIPPIASPGPAMITDGHGHVVTS